MECMNKHAFMLIIQVSQNANKATKTTIKKGEIEMKEDKTKHMQGQRRGFLGAKDDLERASLIKASEATRGKTGPDLEYDNIGCDRR